MIYLEKIEKPPHESQNFSAIFDKQSFQSLGVGGNAATVLANRFLEFIQLALDHTEVLKVACGPLPPFPQVFSVSILCFL